MKVIRVDVHEKLALASVKEGQELDVSVVNYVSPKSKAEPRQSRMNEAHNSECLLRAVWRLDHLYPIWTSAPTLVEAIRTVYGPNPISTSSPDVEMDVDTLEAKEVAFTLVTNKKGGKGKAKASSPPPTNSRNKISLVSRAPPVPKVVTASAASKLAATCSSSAVAAATTSKPAQLQNRPPPVLLASKPKPKAKSFAQAAKVNMSGPKFALVSSHEDFL